MPNGEILAAPAGGAGILLETAGGRMATRRQFIRQVASLAFAGGATALVSRGVFGGVRTAWASDLTARVSSLKGPTSIGIAPVIHDSRAAGERPLEGAPCRYEFGVYGTADEVLPQVIQGKVDIALLPANVAAVLYNKTKGAVRVFDVNTLGVLYVVSGGARVETLADLAGKTVYLTGKGTTPEYVLTYLLERRGIADRVTLEFRSEASEVAALLVKSPGAIGVLPEPYATSACTRAPSLVRALSLTREWDALVGGGDPSGPEDPAAGPAAGPAEDLAAGPAAGPAEGPAAGPAEGPAVGPTGPTSRLVTGVTIASAALVREHPEVLEDFIGRQAASVAWTLANPEEAGKLVAELGIVDSATIAADAIPNCNLACIAGSEMREALEGYLRVLYQANPAAIGGAMPADDFYYLG